MHFPPLEASEALVFVTILERAVEAIWRTHGNEMLFELEACELAREQERQLEREAAKALEREAEQYERQWLEGEQDLF
jgi:hypothetical protein